MKKHNKKFLVLFFTISIGIFFAIQPQNSRNELAKEEIKKQTQGLATKTMNSTSKAHRAPASIPKITTTGKTSTKREVIGSFTDLNNIQIVNKEDKNWKQKYQKNFLRMIGNEPVKDFKIELKRSILKVEDNVGHALEHVVVSYTKPNGNPFSFEALIDSANGQMVHTWNQTRYEFKDKVKLKAQGRKMYKD